jgi:hypothetical protein
VNEQANRDQLATAIEAARLRKFKTISKACVVAGVARGTWEKAERGEKIKTFSLAAIEEALDWPTGQAQAILDGGLSAIEPPPAEPDMGEQMRLILERQRQLEERLAVLERETEAG